MDRSELRGLWLAMCVGFCLALVLLGSGLSRADVVWVSVALVAVDPVLYFVRDARGGGWFSFAILLLGGLVLGWTFAEQIL